uniref:Uncharacterized protein n=1 Tax=Rhizochromulina marina TaxID=1034831 RepID=A0A7S2RGE7_9STRA|mmetsp:Transcript_15964/g.46874  ORF Transcript_15964/g.46874 Transcript_15964/m.46874 type:complete len:382 (+) Transcript_15964:116-1261(+)
MRGVVAFLGLLLGEVALAGPPGLLSARHLGSYEDSTLDYAVESRAYPEAPQHLFVTCRGGGLVVLDTSSTTPTQPLRPPTIGRWDSDLAVEGQDRRGDLYVVAELGVGPNGPIPGSLPRLHVFHNVTAQLEAGALLTPDEVVDLSPWIDAILHVKLLESPQGTFAVCTGGFATTVQGGVVVVQLLQSAEAAPRVAVLEIPVSQPEGVMIVANRAAWVGGISSSALAVVDLSIPLTPSLAWFQDGVGAQLVAASWVDQPFGEPPVGQDAHCVYMAAWGSPGGLVVFNASDPLAPVLLSETKSPRLAMANRVKLYHNVALVPLEQRVGGFGIIDLADAARFSATHVAPSIVNNTKAYCLSVTEKGRVYLFIAETATVHVYEIR